MIFFYILVLLSPMPNHPLFDISVVGLSLVKWLGVVCCGYAIVRLKQRKKQFAFLGALEFRSVLVLLILATFSYFTLSRTEGLSFSPMAMYVNFLLLFFTTIAVVNTLEKLRYALLASIAGAAIASLYVIREYQASGGTNMRPGSIAGDSNYFATCTLLVIPIALYFAKLKGPQWQRWFCVGSLLLMLIAFTLASSRGGLMGLCVTMAYMILHSGQSRKSVIAVTAVLLPLLLLAPASPLARMLHPNYGDYLGSQIREDFWKAGLNMIGNHPLTGIGLGNFTALSYTVTHGIAGRHGMACNTFLEVAAEMGIPGLLAYSAILIGSLFSAGRLRSEGKKRRDAFLQYAGQAIQAGLLGFAAAAFFVSAEYQKPFWIMVALTATVPNLLRQRPKLQSHPCAELIASSHLAVAEA
jgi:O-antigen ligase